jgi:hypothetical protein
MKEQLESLNALSINFGEGGMAIVNIILAFVMFGVALGIRMQTFKEVFKNPTLTSNGLVIIHCTNRNCSENSEMAVEVPKVIIGENATVVEAETEDRGARVRYEYVHTIGGQSISISYVIELPKA